MTRSAIIPIRDFRGMTRLAPVFDAEVRGELGRRLASVAVTAAAKAGCQPVIVSADEVVIDWAASVGVAVALDAGDSLSSAVARASESLDHWMVLHADLPLVSADALRLVLSASVTSGFAIAPSLDGGTNVIAGSGPFRFSFGPDSFMRHLAWQPSAVVVVDPRLALELDTPSHAAALSTIGALSSLDL
jgi:2-phospho-L-lactate guanylyltransferase